MEIKGKVYCFFEQSGTFKNEFKKLGYEAEDYDIQDNFGETDHITDLFAEIGGGMTANHLYLTRLQRMIWCWLSSLVYISVR